MPCQLIQGNFSKTVAVMQARYDENYDDFDLDPAGLVLTIYAGLY